MSEGTFSNIEVFVMPSDPANISALKTQTRTTFLFDRNKYRKNGQAGKGLIDMVINMVYQTGKPLSVIHKYS